MGFNSSAQQFVYPHLHPEANFDSLTTIIDSIYSDSALYNNNLSKIKSYARAKNFWASRLGPQGNLTSGIDELNNGKPTNQCNNGDWVAKGPFEDFISTSTMGVVSTVTADPENLDIILAGTPSSGIFRGTIVNGQFSWSPVTEDLGYGFLPISKIEYSAYNHTNNPNRSVIFASIGSLEENYFNPTKKPFLKSADNGLTWELKGNSIAGGKSVMAFSCHPTIHNFIVFAIEGKLYKSEDGLNTMQSLGVDFSPYKIVDINWGNSGASFFASTRATEDNTPNSAKIYRFDLNFSTLNFSQPNNITPKLPNATNPDSLAFIYHATSNNYSDIYLVARKKGDSKDYFYAKSTDFGYNWTGIVTDTHEEVNQLFCSPIKKDNLLVCTMWTDFFRVKNYPTTFNNNTFKTHPDIRWVHWTENSQGEDYIIVANDGGLQRFIGDFSAEFSSLNQGAKWENLNGIGLSISEIYNFDFSIERDWITGHMHNYANRYNINTGNWESFDSAMGDGSGVHTDKMEPSRIIYQSNGCFRTRNGNGNQFRSKVYESYEGNNNCGDEFKLMDMPFSQNNLNPKNFSIGVRNYHLSTNRGVNFSPILTGIDGNTPVITAISNAPNNPNVSYFSRNIITYGSNNPSGLSVFNKVSNLTSTPVVTDLSSPNSNPPNQGNQNFKNAIDRGFITEIIVAPNNENELWVGFSGYHESNNNYKVFYSNDGGTNWEDKTHNLPNAPINCMTVDWHNRAIYVGTDYGVYYKELYGNEWVCYSGGLGTGVVNNLKIDYCSNKLIAATYGRGMWEVDLPNTTPVEPIPLEITQSLTVDYDNSFETDVRITNNSTLTLENCTWRFAKGARLIVEAGSKVIIDGATLTSLCPNQMWEGVLVKNNNGTNKQYDYTNGIPGQFIAKIASTIENTKVGVSVGSKTNHSINGGIVNIQASTIKNCEIGIAFHPYKEFSKSGMVLPNKSRIFDNDFITTSAYKDFTNSANPHEFIYAAGIPGLNVIANTFENLNPTTFSANERGFGIWCYDTKINVLGNCSTSSPTYPPTCNPASIVNNEFKNLFYGIRNASVNDFYTTRVDYATFDGNIRGIYLINQTATQVTNCNFDPASLEVLENNSIPVNEAYGIYLQECTDYLITNNNFESYIGAYVYNLNPYAAKTNIYKNYFNSDRAGIVGIKENRGIQVQNEYKVDFGFQFQCNEFDRTKYDVFVTDEPGISMMVGSPSSSLTLAGNTFDGCTVTNGELNDQTLGFDYHHHNTLNYTPASGCHTSNVVSVNFGDGFEEGDCPSKVYKTVGDLNSPLNDILIEITNQNAFTPKDEEWQIEMGYLQHDFQLIYADIFNTLAQQDSNINQHDSLLDILAMQDTNNFRNAQLGSWYLFQEDFENANAVFDSLASDSVFANYAAVQAKIAELIEDTVNLTTLTGDDSSFFYNYYNDSTLRGYLNARIILEQMGLYQVQEYYPAIDELKRSAVRFNNNEETLSLNATKTKKEAYRIYPNPTKGLVNVYATEDNLNLQIISIEGKIVKARKIGMGINLVEIEGLSTGLYQLRITDSKGDLKFEQKLSIL